MNNIRFLIIALLISSCKTSSTKPIDNSLITEKEVAEFITNYDRAWEKRDTTAMIEMMDEKYIYFTSTGSTTTKDKILGWFTPADKYKMDTAYRNEISILLNGNTAIVSSHWVGSGSFGDVRFNDDQRCGLVVQKLNGKLKLISEHCVQIER